MGIASGYENLTVGQYFRIARESDRFSDSSRAARDTVFNFGLIGEVGGLLSGLKKLTRDDLNETQRLFAVEELGDALWYLVQASYNCGLKPEDLGRQAYVWLCARLSVPTTPQTRVTFDTLDTVVQARQKFVLASRYRFLKALAYRCGVLVQRDYHDNSRLDPQLFVEILAHMALISGRFGLTLREIALANIHKTQGRWPRAGSRYVPLFDSEFEPHEQLPRKFEVDFIQRTRGAKTVVVQRVNGIYIGDPLTDNSNEPDGYRFHDVFHLAYAVHLGWSPVIRALFKVKRKSNNRYDENEDGARAMIIEEGIATWIFNNAKKQELFKNVEPGRLDFSLLKQIQNIVAGYEVQECPLWQWERAILDGLRVFRDLNAAQGGTVAVDLKRRTLRLKPLVNLKKKDLSRASTAQR